jgi:hypothetical protein
MKFSSFSIAAALFVVTAKAQSSEDDRGCISQVEEGKDYFPNKAIPKNATLFTIDYFDTYKVVENLATNSSFVLYQCGSEPPTDAVTKFTPQVIEIPVRNVGVEQTVTIPFLDTLGELDEIAIFMTDIQYVSSPCFLDRINNGDVLVAADLDGQTDLVSQAEGGNQDLQSLLQDMVAFVGPFSTTPFAHPVPVSEYLETTNAAIYEWMLFYAAFFNKEDVGNQAVMAAADRYECVAENAARVQADFPEKPVVLWGSYSSYCGGWNFAKCPNFYCEIAEACSTELLFDDPNAGSLELCGGYIFKTLEEFIEFGKDADYWFYDNDNALDTIVEFGDELQAIKAFSNKQVFDYQGAGPNKWYEERFGSYYDLVQDYCGIVGTTRELQGQGWFRNVFTEPVGDGGTCTENGGNSLLPYNFECEPSEFDPIQEGATTSGARSNLWSSLLVVTLSAWLVAFTTM